MISRATLLAAAMQIVVLVGGCGILGGGVDTKTEADVRTAVEQRASDVAALVGGALTDPSVNASPCTGRMGESSSDVFTVRGVWVVPLPADQHLDTLRRVRDGLKAKHWDITEDRQFEANAGMLTARSDDYEVNLTSNDKSSALAMMVTSPCFASPTPR
jgi:hypothetical protein